MGKIKEYFTDRGLTAADLPKALIIHVNPIPEH